MSAIKLKKMFLEGYDTDSYGGEFWLLKAAPEGAILVPLFIRLMTPNGAILSKDQRTAIMR